METSRTSTTRFALRNSSRIAYDPGLRYADLHFEDVPLLVLHDLLGDRASFAPLIEQMPNRRVISIDARGHGASATLANQWYSLAELADDVVAVLDAEAINALHVLGHGLGAATAFDLARRFPSRVKSLAMIEPPLYGLLGRAVHPLSGTAREDRRQSDRASADAAYKGLIEKSLDAYLAPRWGADWRDRTAKSRLGAIRRHAGALAGILPALDGYVVTSADVASITMAARVFVADDSPDIDRWTGDALNELLPNAWLETFHFTDRINAPFAETTADHLAQRVVSVIARSEGRE